MEYRLLDSGNLRKLEAVGEYRLIRPIQILGVNRP